LYSESPGTPWRPGSGATAHVRQDLGVENLVLRFTEYLLQRSMEASDIQPTGWCRQLLQRSNSLVVTCSLGRCNGSHSPLSPYATSRGHPVRKLCYVPDRPVILTSPKARWSLADWWTAYKPIGFRGQGHVHGIHGVKTHRPCREHDKATTYAQQINL
jgi:hypothetical protein